MARIRSIKPEFFRDEDLARLPFQLRLVYIGLWCQADKSGRLEDRPERLKVEIMPYDRCNMDAMLTTLATVKETSGLPFIVRYTFEGKKYIQVVSWAQHQRPHLTEAETKLPPPPSEILEDLTVNAPLGHPSKTLGREGKGREGKGITTRLADVKEPTAPPELPKELEPERAIIELWLQYKKERREGYKPTGLAALFGRIKGIPPDKRKAAIENSMAQGWKGIYEARENGYAKPSESEFTTYVPGKYDHLSPMPKAQNSV